MLVRDAQNTHERNVHGGGSSDGSAKHISIVQMPHGSACMKEVSHPLKSASASVSSLHLDSKMRVHSIELYDDMDVLVAGEIGYTFGTTYTSLTGFYDKKVPNAGKLQLVLLSKWLEQSGYTFWNFGHPPRRLVDGRGCYKLSAPTDRRRNR